MSEQFAQWVPLILFLMLFAPFFILFYIATNSTKGFENLIENMYEAQLLIDEAAKSDTDEKIHNIFLKTASLGVDVTSKEKEDLFYKMVLKRKLAIEAEQLDTIQN